MLLLVLLSLPFVSLAFYLWVVFPRQVRTHRSYVQSVNENIDVPSVNPVTPLTNVIDFQDFEGQIGRMHKYFKYGMYQVCFLYQWWVHLFDSNLIASIFNKPDDNYDRIRRRLGLVSDFTGISVIGTSGEPWKRQHRILIKAFTPSNIQRFIPLFLSSLQSRVVPEIEEMMSKDGKVDINRVFQGMSLDLITEAGFASNPSETAELRGLFETIRDGFGNPIYVLPFSDYLTFLPGVKKTYDALTRINELAMNLIHKRRKVLQEQQQQQQQNLEKQESDSKDDTSLSKRPIKYLIDLLLEAHDDETNSQLSDVELKDNVLLFLLAGSETTAVSILWFLHNLLASDPKIYEKLQTEIDTVIPSDPMKMTYQDVSSLTYLNCILYESMRITPTVPNSGIRVMKRDTQVGQWVFKKGTEVTASILNAHMNPLNFPNPEVFDPDRWDTSSKKCTGLEGECSSNEVGEEGPKKEKELVQTYFDEGKYGPFGFGRRICLGKSFAYLEMRVALSFLLRTFKFSVPKDEVFPKKKIIKLPTVYPEGTLNLFVTRR